MGSIFPEGDQRQADTRSSVVHVYAANRILISREEFLELLQFPGELRRIKSDGNAAERKFTLSRFQDQPFSITGCETMPQAEIVHINSGSGTVVKYTQKVFGTFSDDKIGGIERRKQKIVGCQLLFFLLVAVKQFAAVKVGTLC